MHRHTPAYYDGWHKWACMYTYINVYIYIGIYIRMHRHTPACYDGWHDSCM